MSDTPTNGELNIMFENLQKNENDKHVILMKSIKDLTQEFRQWAAQLSAYNKKVDKHNLYFKIIWWSLGAFFSLVLYSFPYLRTLVQYEARETVQSAVSAEMSKYDEKIRQTVNDSLTAVLSKYDIDITDK